MFPVMTHPASRTLPLVSGLAPETDTGPRRRQAGPHVPLPLPLGAAVETLTVDLASEWGTPAAPLRAVGPETPPPPGLALVAAAHTPSLGPARTTAPAFRDPRMDTY